MLKLDEDKIVTHAIHGFDKLRMSDIKKLYGDPPRFTKMKWPDAVRVMDEEKGAHWTMMGLAKAIKVPIVCQVMHLMKTGVI